MSIATVDRWSTYWKRITSAYVEAKKAELEKAINRAKQRLLDIQFASENPIPTEYEGNVMDIKDKTDVLHLVKDVVPDDTLRAIIESLATIRQYSKHMSELQSEVAKLRKAKYEASIAAGFTPEQALELCKDVNQLV